MISNKVAFVKKPTPLRTLLGIKPVRPFGLFQPVVIEGITKSGEYYPYNTVEYIFHGTALNFTTTYTNATYGPIVFTHETGVDGVEKSERVYLLRKGDKYNVKLSKSFEEPCTAAASGKALIGPYESDSYEKKFKIGTLEYEPNPVENYPLSYPWYRKWRVEYSSYLKRWKRHYPPTSFDFDFGIEGGDYITSKNRTYYIPKPRGSITPYVRIKNISNVSLHPVELNLYVVLAHEDEHYINVVANVYELFDVMRPNEEHKLSYDYTCDWDKDYGHVYLEGVGFYKNQYYDHEVDYTDLKLGRGFPP